jgi:hypothetical protein
VEVSNQRSPTSSSCRSSRARKTTKYLALFAAETSDLAAVKRGTSVRDTPNPGQDVAGTRDTFRAFAPQVLGDDLRAERTKGTIIPH